MPTLNTLSTAIVAFALAGLGVTAAQAENTFLNCDAFAVEISPEEGLARVTDRSINRTFNLVPSNRPDAYWNDAEEISLELQPGESWVLWAGDVSFACTFPNASTQTHASGAVGGNEGPVLNVPGRTFGGNLRNGPGTNFSRAGSANDGDSITIVQNTGVHFDGYDWYAIRLGNGANAYIWGALICAEGQSLPGTNGDCAQYYNTNGNAGSSASGTTWKAFATGPNGIWGHGAAPLRQNAVENALRNCPGGCNIVAETQSRCQAMAVVPGGFWFGDAANINEAEVFALGFCTRDGGQACRIEYSYCD